MAFSEHAMVIVWIASNIEWYWKWSTLGLVGSGNETSHGCTTNTTILEDNCCGKLHRSLLFQSVSAQITMQICCKRAAECLRTIPGITSLWCIYVAPLFHQFIGKHVCTFPPKSRTWGKACKYCKYSLLKGALMWDILITDTGWRTSANTYSRTFSIFYLLMLTFRSIKSCLIIIIPIAAVTFLWRNFTTQLASILPGLPHHRGEERFWPCHKWSKPDMGMRLPTTVLQFLC